MNVSDDFSQINFVKNFTISFHKYILFGLYILSNIGNVLSALVFFQRSWKKNVCVFYFQILLLLNTCYINIYTTGSIIMFGFEINFLLSNLILCKIYLYIWFVLITILPSILVLATIDRLLISSQNIDTRLYSSKRLAYFSLSVCAIIWLVINMHALFAVQIVDFYSSYLLCTFISSKLYATISIYFLATLNVIAYILMIILCTLSFKNIRHIRVFPSKQRRREFHSMTKKDFQLLRCLFVQDIIYIIFSTILIIYYVYLVKINNQIENTSVKLSAILLNQSVTSFFNIFYSTYFLVFFFVSKAFRHELKRIVYKLVRKMILPLQEETIERNRNAFVINTIE